jgi:hypothetical protein
VRLYPVPLLFIVASGCSGEPTIYPVTGTVTINGKPTGKVLVNVYPADGSAHNFGTRHAIGITDAQGKFKLICSGGMEGIEAGQYKVTFSRPMVRGQAALTDANSKPEDSGTVESIPKDYTQVETTPVYLKIPKGGGDFTLDVKMP